MRQASPGPVSGTGRLPGVKVEVGTSIVIVGAGGFGREVLQYVRDAFGTGDDVVKGFLDDRSVDLASFGLSYPILGDTHSYRPAPGDRLIVAVGEPRVRAEIVDRFDALGAWYATVVHPSAYVSAAARLGHGCIVAPFATIGAHAELGDHSVLTYYASVGHDASVGRYCALSPHSVANGGSRLGDRVLLGAHAVVNPLQTVGDDAKVAAGAVVYRPVPGKTLASGNPAKSRPVW